MPANPEIPQPIEMPQVQERLEEFPETIQQIQGTKVVQKHFKSQVTDDNGTPLITTPPAQVITTVQPPADTQTLTKKSKGPITSGATWVAAFWLRIIKKALHFGWKIIGKDQN